MTPAYTVLIADTSIRPEGIELLKKTASVVELPAYCAEEDLIAAAHDADAILARACVISKAVIQAAPRLKIVCRHGVGFDNVDVEECTRLGIPVSITEEANSEAVSEQAFACILALATRVAQANSNVRSGRWDRDRFVGVELHGKVLGIFGLGRIGSRTARHAAAFDMRVLACDPYITEGPAAACGADLVDGDTLLTRADFVSIHTPLNAETRHLIGKRELALMKATAMLVNTARGGIIDERALYEALVAGQLAGAALDVFEQEPVAADHPLLTLDTLLCSPHVAGQTEESMVRMSLGAAENILRVFRGEVPSSVVNPEVLSDRARVDWQTAKDPDPVGAPEIEVAVR